MTPLAVDAATMARRLRWPDRRVDAVLDTDTYNEIDDQFALAYLVRSPERIHLRAVYAAPFHNDKSTGPADGMEKSYQEIRRVLTLLDRADLHGIALRGSDRYLPDEDTPVASDAARDLARRAMEYTPEEPLYVIAIGAITNVASAILLEPRIRDRIVIVWLGGNALHWPDAREFNLMQDVAAARIAFGCGAALVQLPCMGVVSAFGVSAPELSHWLAGKNALCDYLADVTIREVESYRDHKPAWSKCIWDVTAVAWLIDPAFTSSYLAPSPVPQYDCRYSLDPTRHAFRYVYHIHRDAVMTDLFQKLAR